MNNCACCGKETTNPRFCSKSCSAKIARNSAIFVENVCTKCGIKYRENSSWKKMVCRKCFSDDPTSKDIYPSKDDKVQALEEYKEKSKKLITSYNIESIEFLEGEEFRDVIGFENRYMISSHGRFFSKLTNKLLKQQTRNDGYKYLTLSMSGRNFRVLGISIHRVVAEAFLGKPSDELIENCLRTSLPVVPVNHKDGNKSNNHYSNLEWCTYSQNTFHSYANRLQVQKKGTEHHNAKLSEADVRYIRENLENKTYKELGAMFNVHEKIIYKVRNFITYKNVI